MLSDETENDSIYTNNILNDSLDMRKKWCEEMNKKYNLNISVEISKYLIATPQQEKPQQECHHGCKATNAYSVVIFFEHI